VGNAAVWTAQQTPDSWKGAIRDFADGGLRFIDNWYSQPFDCDCSYGGPASYMLNSEFYAPGLGTRTSGAAGNWGAQGLWALGSTPAVRTGTITVEQFKFFTTRTIRIPRLLRWLPEIGNWQTTIPKYEPGWYATNQSTGIINRGWLGSQKDGLYRTGFRTRVRLTNTNYQGVFNFIKGMFGSVALAGLIDGVFQFGSDSALCNLSAAQRYNRFFLATALGVVGGGGATLGFIGATALGAPVIAAAGAAFVTGWIWGEFVAHPIKNHVFASDPRYR
jgi:hypothetical protein